MNSDFGLRISDLVALLACVMNPCSIRAMNRSCGGGTGALLAAMAGAFWAAAGWAQPLPEQIDAVLQAVPGNSWTALVVNESNSAVYYHRNPTNGLAPASNTKLFTTAAAFGLLGTDSDFETRVYGEGASTNGVLDGNLNLVCEHDPTWNTTVFTNARAPLDHIAARLKALGMTAVASNVQCYGACAYDLSSTGFLNSRNTEGRNAEAATAFVAALKAQGISVAGTGSGRTGFTAPGALYYTHHSSDLSYRGRPLRLDIACIPLLKVSHNVMADLLCRHIGWKLDGVDSYAAGTARVSRWLHDSAGLNTNGMVLNDGSGLSRGNRVSAAQCVELTRYMLGAFPTWSDGLPVGCVDGTIRRRFCGTPGAGQVHAKTGSLGTAISLSGYLDNKFEHRRYLFSFIGNAPRIEQTATRQAIDQAVVLFAAPPSAQPQISLSNNVVTLTWAAVAGASYRLEFKERLSDPVWQRAGPDITAAQAGMMKVDAVFEGAPQRFYRICLLGGER
jgi:D-alanyl-D-alanine carboxypeptidase